MVNEHHENCHRWFFCGMATPGHWYPGTRQRPVNWCYEHRWPGTRQNPDDIDDCACETIEEQAYESAMHTKLGDRY